MSSTHVLTPKAPGERVDYVWTPPLDAGDTISGTPTDAARVSGAATLDAQTNTATTVTMTFTTGADGETSEFTGEVTTVGGRIWQATFYLPVAESAYTAPGAKLVEIFPAFAGLASNVVNYWVERALETTSEWGDDHATILLAAHLMATNGLGANPAINGLTSWKSGAVAMDFSETQANAKGYDQTPYGQQFRVILRRRTAGPRNAYGAVAGDCGC